MSPELMLRPSLSGARRRGGGGADRGRVAGAYAPAFVERGRWATHGGAATGGVAGAYAPAFVERITPRARKSAGCWCRRSLCSGLR